ncbi:MAG TPA: serine/threonine-protein kinase [Candidatus Kapabacteria bacterium]|nr:serine/threonine-protein kinase [Candidatus Kapabacteria bacterium]
MPKQNNKPLPRGYQLLNYTIVKQLSAGGFSIVYLAHDEHDYPVAIKEYLPSTLVLRTEGDMIIATSEEKLATFRYGLKCFFEEGKTLAHISHNNVVRVLNFFRANETVYMVMEYERGRTLQKEIQLHPEGVREELIRHVFYQLLNGLREVHLRKMLHLDIKPANIYLRRDGTPVLLDFGSARRMLGPDRPRFTPMYTPGFAPPEQYKDRDNLGPWSDIYSIGASMFACLAGYAPQAADQRLEHDRHISTRKVWAGKYSDQLLNIIDWCLQLNYLERPQSVHALQKALLTPAGDPPSKPSLMVNLRSTLTGLANLDIRELFRR